jgi:uncharacterized protein
MIDSFRPNGTCMDLLAPALTDIDFDWMARRLSRINRFNGDGMSVAQHSVMGAQALLNEGESRQIVTYFLLHDGHEFALGDIATPVQKAIALSVRPAAMGPLFKNAFDDLKEKWDGVIYAAAGLMPPTSWTNAEQHVVKAMDLRMMCAEAIDLFGTQARHYLPFDAWQHRPKLTGSLAIWGAAKAEEKFLSMLADMITPARIARQKAAFDTASEKAKRS